VQRTPTQEAILFANHVITVSVTANQKDPLFSDWNFFMLAMKMWISGGITGLSAGVLFVLLTQLFSADDRLSLLELAIAFFTPGLIPFLVCKVTRFRTIIFLAVAYLTIAVPILGPVFGGTGSEPLWNFAVLGLLGGLVWIAPFAIWKLLKTPN
jgi:hypothetical protein